MECRQEIELRRVRRLDMLKSETQESRQAYVQQRKQCKKIMRNKKRKYTGELLAEIEENYNNKEIKSLYQGIKRERKGYQQRPVYYKNKHDQLIGNEGDIMEMWKEYFRDLLNSTENQEEDSEQEKEVEEENIIADEPPTLLEIEQIIGNLKNNKSPGNDQITSEMLKYGGETISKWIHKLVLKIWEQEKLPANWNEAVIIPIYKKGERMDCANYRGIASLNVAYKILSSALKNRLVYKLDQEIGECQSGFRGGRSVVDQIFTLGELQSESYEYNKETHVLFIDFKQAYDTIKRKYLYIAMQELGIKGKLFNLIRLTLKETTNCVRVGSRTSTKFGVREGLRQGDPLSSLLFSCVLEYVIRKAKLHRNGLLYNKKH